MKNNFDKYCIIGLGLIGGSIGLGLKKKKLNLKLWDMLKHKNAY
ncbi:MAG: hypothetical protein CM15mP109_01220 [Candidatus Dadabacteria bacterium]|nr:MAG: hypothetical protein CM15mP109_01220 [Candidatus Dadabacteria bacterium]